MSAIPAQRIIRKMARPTASLGEPSPLIDAGPAFSFWRNAIKKRA